jgi:S-adenosylmethionine decarboxylase
LLFNSESSFFVSPHRLILKTCGTTLNLLGLPRILEIAAKEAKLHSVYRLFYSRKSFMFPERQHGPHKDWKQEVEYLDQFFKNGAAYTIGKVNGDHWLLYMATADDDDLASSPQIESINDRQIDYTIEILMSDLSPKASERFFFSESASQDDPSSRGLDISHELGITKIFPSSLTNLDAFAFTPCGYSSNALIKWDHGSLVCDSDTSADHSRQNGQSNSIKNGDILTKPGHSGEGYYTIHVTPEQGWSYASFECNIPLSSSSKSPHEGKIPDLKSLIKRVVNIFEPSRITLTLFISSEDNDVSAEGESPIEAAQRAFKAALTSCGADSEIHGIYKRTDKINYEFGSYDLAFASFELK